jgi:hypothetical protein
MFRRISKSQVRKVTFHEDTVKKKSRPILHYEISADALTEANADLLKRYSVESATKASHQDSYNAWIRYTVNSGRPNCVISVATLQQFCVYEHMRGVTSDTSKVRLGGIGKTAVRKGILTSTQWNDMRCSSELRETRAAILKLELKLGYEHRRADPISIAEVEKLALDAKGFDEVVLSLMIATAFFGLNRMGELADKSAEKLKEILKLPRFANLKLGKKSVSFVIQSTKTGSWQEKVIDIVDCPKWYLGLWEKYLKDRRKLGLSFCPYLFVLANGNVPTTSQVNDFIKNMVDREMTTHSCRAGGATYLALCGASFIEIMLAGRWNSWAFIQYIRCLKKMELAMKASGSLPPGYKI